MLSKETLSLIHLDRMSDATGLIQHGIYSLPRRESGYTTDDNARALRLCVRIWRRNPSSKLLSRIACYLSFLEHARAPSRGFHNFMGYQRDWLDSGGTEDCQGQTILALADSLGSHLPQGFHSLALELITGALPAAKGLRSLRAQAYLVQAWYVLSKLEIACVDGLESIARTAADRLLECYRRSNRHDWLWFESRLTYANAVLPHALFDAAALWKHDGYGEVAKKTIDFLDLTTTYNHQFWPVGNHDWFSHGEEKALYDQQPVEASTMASAALAAREVTCDDRYQQLFDRCYTWFAGANSLGLPLADPKDGSCCDGLTSSGLNLNQGAESTLAFLWTQLLSEENQQGPSAHPFHINSLVPTVC